MQLRKVRIVSPARIVFAVFCAFLAVWFGAGWLFSMSSQLNLSKTELDEWELDAQMKSIERRLSIGEDEILSLLIPEGTLFCNSLYGVAIVAHASRQNADIDYKAKVCSKLEWLITRVEALSRRHPFNLNENLKPRGGIIIAGHANLLRAGYVLLGGANPVIKKDFDTDSHEIYEAFISGKTAFPECYQGHTWAQDSVFALESLRLHDALLGTNYSGACKRWSSELKEHIDPQSGLMVAQIDPSTNKSIEAARGCATAWGLAYMPQLEPEFARRQYARFKQDWFVPFLGCSGIYEWNGGHETPTNFYAGPVIFGLGAAASGIGIATTRSNQDVAEWHRLLRSLEFFGLPTIAPTGEKSYFFNLSLLSDVVALWGKTISPWGTPVKPSAPGVASQTISLHSSKVGPFDQYYIAIGIALVLSIALTLVLSARAFRLIRDTTSVKPSCNKVTMVSLAVQICCILLFFFCPLFTWMQIVVFMAISDLLEELTIRPGIIGKLYDDNEQPCKD